MKRFLCSLCNGNIKCWSGWKYCHFEISSTIKSSLISLRQHLFMSRLFWPLALWPHIQSGFIYFFMVPVFLHALRSQQFNPDFIPFEFSHNQLWQNITTTIFSFGGTKFIISRNIWPMLWVYTKERSFGLYLLQHGALVYMASSKGPPRSVAFISKKGVPKTFSNWDPHRKNF